MNNYFLIVHSFHFRLNFKFLMYNYFKKCIAKIYFFLKESFNHVNNFWNFMGKNLIGGIKRKYLPISANDLKI